MINLYVYRRVNGETLTEMFTLSNRNEAETLGDDLAQLGIIDWYEVANTDNYWLAAEYLKDKWGIE